MVGARWKQKLVEIALGVKEGRIGRVLTGDGVRWSRKRQGEVGWDRMRQGRQVWS